MRTILFAATKPDDQVEWSKFIQFTQAKVSPWPPGEVLSENVWILRLPENLVALSWLIATADQQRISYRLLQLDDEPQWLLGDPNAGTIPAHRN